MNLIDIRAKLEQQKGQQIQIEQSIVKTKDIIKLKRRDLHSHEQARELVREAGLKTQQSLSFHISEITSLALAGVFDDPYTLEVEFVERRNKTECDLFFTRNGNSINPIDASGGGAVDIASFALRIASWSMENPRHRPTIILDEPLKNLDDDRIEKGSAMLKEVSERLGIQFIIVTHEEALTAWADKVFKVSNRKGVSYVN